MVCSGQGWQLWAVADPAGGGVLPSAELCRGGHARVYLRTSAWLCRRLPVPVPASPLAEFQRRYVSCGEKELFMPQASINPPSICSNTGCSGPELNPTPDRDKICLWWEVGRGCRAGMLLGRTQGQIYRQGACYLLIK